jgi:CHAT domain-containing protein
MRSKRWLSKIILLALAAILTFVGELILVPILLPKADAQDNYNHAQIPQNSPNPQSLLEKGKQLYDVEKFSEAISVLEQAAQILANQGNQIKQAVALSNISLAYKQIGEYQQALSYITQSRNLLETQPNLRAAKERLKIFAQVLDIQANLQLTLGKSLPALDNWKQATAIYEQVNLSDEKIRSLINQNLALQALGRYHQSRKILEQVLPDIEKQPASVIKVTLLRSLGDIQLYLGEIDASLKTLQQSYEIAQEIKSNPQIAATLLSFGNAKRAKGNQVQSRLQNTANLDTTTPLLYVTKPISPEVRKLYQQAVQLYEQTVAISTSPVIKFKAQLNLFSVLIELQEFSNAGTLYSQLQSAIKQLPLSQTSSHARINLAKYLLFLKQVSPTHAPQWEDIAQILATAIKQAQILEDGRSQAYGMGILASVYLQTQNLTDAQQLTEKALNLALGIETKDIAYLWQWQLGYIFKLQNNIAEAIDYYSQAVNNLNNLRSDLLILNPDLQFSFRDDVEPVYRQFVDLLLQPSSSQNISQTNLKQARDVIEALQLGEIENYFQEACLQAKPEIVDTVVDKTDTTAAVIYPMILQNRLEIILKLPNQNRFNHYTTFIAANEVEKTLEKLQDSLRQPEQINQVKKISGEVYSWLIEPLEVDLQENQVETLVFVLDGTLRNIPMAVLYDNKSPEKEQKYLIEKYAIVLTPGLQMLTPKPLQQQKLNVLIAGVSEKRFVENQKFNALPNVQIEIEKIQSQIQNSKKLLNQSFTDTNLQKQINDARYTIVHIATHGNFSSNLEETYILTWNKLLRVKDFDKLFQINTNTDSQAIQLLVLSACETASGDKRATLGLSGIAVRAGARSTLATLWAVEDKSTAELMVQFYRELQKNKLNKAKALQQAQINLLRNRDLPLIWASYVLVGNWL